MARTLVALVRSAGGRVRCAGPEGRSTGSHAIAGDMLRGLPSMNANRTCVSLLLAAGLAVACQDSRAARQAEARAREKAEVWGFLSAKYDRNRDGRIERAEYDRG